MAHHVVENQRKTACGQPAWAEVEVLPVFLFLELFFLLTSIYLLEAPWHETEPSLLRESSSGPVVTVAGTGTVMHLDKA